MQDVSEFVGDHALEFLSVISSSMPCVNATEACEDCGRWRMHSATVSGSATGEASGSPSCVRVPN